MTEPPQITYHNLNWKLANYLSIESVPKIIFTLNTTLPCDLPIQLSKSQENPAQDQINLLIPNSSNQFIYALEQPKYVNFLNFEDHTLFVNNVINQTISCNPEDHHFITTDPDLISNPRFEFFFYNSSILQIITSLIGWLYFLAWSVSFYPQVLLNSKRKSTNGLNVDFVVLNVIGFLCYSIYNFQLYFDETVIKQYYRQFPDNVEAVEVNDLVFSIGLVGGFERMKQQKYDNKFSIEKIKYSKHFCLKHFLLIHSNNMILNKYMQFS